MLKRALHHGCCVNTIGIRMSRKKLGKDIENKDLQSLTLYTNPVHLDLENDLVLALLYFSKTQRKNCKLWSDFDIVIYLRR